MSPKHLAFVFGTALYACTALANVFFYGKAVLGGSTVNCPIDVTRILWGDDDMKSGDRIQGQIQVSKIVEQVESIRIIIQGINSAGEVVETYALTLSRGNDIGGHYFGSQGRYPFPGVIFLRYERGYIDKEMENAWFYFDFPKSTEVKNFLIVNMVLNGREVPYNLRLVGNRLPRSLTTMPRIKNGHRGDFSVTTEWIPPPTPIAESELVKNKKGDKAARKTDDESKAHVTLSSRVDEIAGETIYTAPINWNLALQGANLAISPSVIATEGKPSIMTLAISGNSTVSTGYGLRLEKIFFFDPTTKKRAVIGRDNTAKWPRYYVGSQPKDVKLDLNDEAVGFLSEAQAIRCRLAFGISDVPDARNFDFSFSAAQVLALRTLAKKARE